MFVEHEQRMARRSDAVTRRPAEEEHRGVGRLTVGESPLVRGVTDPEIEGPGLVAAEEVFEDQVVQGRSRREVAEGFVEGRLSILINAVVLIPGEEGARLPTALQEVRPKKSARREVPEFAPKGLGGADPPAEDPVLPGFDGDPLRSP